MGEEIVDSCFDVLFWSIFVELENKDKHLNELRDFTSIHGGSVSVELIMFDDVVNI